MCGFPLALETTQENASQEPWSNNEEEYNSQEMINVQYSLMSSGSITLFRAITVFCGTNSILQNIPHIQIECEEYSVVYCQSEKIFPTFNLNVGNIL
jgi:hypothetical protein